jgi:hypothetical protein
MDQRKYVFSLYGDVELAPCPFTAKEVDELTELDEMLVYVPAKLAMADMCARWEIRSNVDFEHEPWIRNVMVDEAHWFVTSAKRTPELLFQSAQTARRAYEDDGLHGMDFRRYLAFAATYRWRFDRFPDEVYWTFLLSGSYDRSGISIVGFDRHGVLNHHGWMKNFRAKFAGSRYAALAPRIEITEETGRLARPYRGRRGACGQEGTLD